MISDEKFAASRELMEQSYNYLRDGYEQALNALEEAETENAKLRKELESVGIAAYLYGRDDLKAENAKLRELAHILCHCMQVHAKCDDCRLNGAKGELGHDPLAACDGLHEMLRELGIEVD